MGWRNAASPALSARRCRFVVCVCVCACIGFGWREYNVNYLYTYDRYYILKIITCGDVGYKISCNYVCLWLYWCWMEGGKVS